MAFVVRKKNLGGEWGYCGWGGMGIYGYDVGFLTQLAG